MLSQSNGFLQLEALNLGDVRSVASLVEAAARVHEACSSSPSEQPWLFCCHLVVVFNGCARVGVGVVDGGSGLLLSLVISSHSSHRWLLLP